MYITDSNQYAIELVTYLLVLVVYFYEFIVYMLLERIVYYITRGETERLHECEVCSARVKRGLQ